MTAPLQLDLWPIPFLFAAHKAETDAELQRRLRETPFEAVDAIRRQRLANFAINHLGTTGIVPQAVEALQRAATVELGWIAKRNLAMTELDAYCHENGLTACVIKGACTSRLYYPKETLRWSNDIDVVFNRYQLRDLFPDEMLQLEECDYAFPRLHVSRKIFAETAVEMHFRFSLCQRWGNAETIREHMEQLKGYKSLYIPMPRVSATIILLHILKDRGRGAFDLLDWHYLGTAGVLDWQELTAYWTEYHAIPFILPALRLAHNVTGCVPEEVIHELEATLNVHDRQLVTRLIKYIDAPQVTRLKNLRVRCDLMERSFFGFCIEGLLGNSERTQRITGYSRRHPLFWVHHCGLLPAKRIFAFAQKYLHSEEPD